MFPPNGLDLAGFEIVQFLIDNGDGTVDVHVALLPAASCVASPERPNSVRGFGCLGQIARPSRRGSTATVAVLTTAGGPASSP